MNAPTQQRFPLATIPHGFTRLGDGRIASDSDWMLLSHGELPKSSGDLSILQPPRLWTDDHSDLLQILKK